MNKRLTIAYSTHRPETLPFARQAMAGHDLVILEEPPAENFRDMLNARISVDEYLLDKDYEFPLFAKRSCELWRELHEQGVTLAQVEPYLEVLADIHEFFAEGGAPERIEGGMRRMVYKVERGWTAALMRFYEVTAGGDFDAAVQSIIDFARRDALRGKFRDELRAKAVSWVLPGYENVYVEAGSIHFALPGQLAKVLDSEWSLNCRHLMAPVVRPRLGQSVSLGPGDVLTCILTARPDEESERIRLLAAQSLVHVKIIKKEEMDAGDSGSTPHTLDEITADKLSKSLTYDQCHRLYERIARLATSEASRLACEFIAAEAPE